MGNIKLASIDECTGCKACVVSCNKGAISFVESEKTLHTYPIINSELCVNCKKCVKNCPIINFDSKKRITGKYDVRTFCGWIKDGNIRAQSTSGGLGSALAQTAIKLEYIVVGAKFDDHWNLSHDIAKTEPELVCFRGSKYLLSDVEDALKKTLILLNGGKKVFFIGTPCQCESIKSISGPKYEENLLTCSIICHGVNSPRVWNDYVRYIETKHKSKLSKYNFRSKKSGWGKLNVYYSFVNGKRVNQKARNNLFHVWFGRHYNQRLSCFNCKYRSKERFTDFVIGDFWGIEKIMPNLDTKNGVSVLLVNSEKADIFINHANNMALIETQPDSTMSVLKGFAENQSYVARDEVISANARFAEDYKTLSFSEMSKKYSVPSIIAIINDWICSKIRLI